jgi:hypothetical protein
MHGCLALHLCIFCASQGSCRGYEVVEEPLEMYQMGASVYVVCGG